MLLGGGGGEGEGVEKFSRLGVCQSIQSSQLYLEALNFHETLQEQFTGGYLERYGDKCLISYCKVEIWHIFKIQQLSYLADL